MRAVPDFANCRRRKSAVASDQHAHAAALNCNFRTLIRAHRQAGWGRLKMECTARRLPAPFQRGLHGVQMSLFARRGVLHQPGGRAQVTAGFSHQRRLGQAQ